MARTPARYIRFAVQGIDPSNGVPQGLFQVAAAVREVRATPPYDVDRLAEITWWFNVNLARPTRSDRNLAKRDTSFHKRGISWFKASAAEHIAMMGEMSVIVAEHGHAVDQIETDRPGYLIYEDEHQIVAEPFADTPTSK